VKGATKMEISNHVQVILDGTTLAIQSVVPLNVDIQQGSFMNEPYIQQEIGVLIGFTGDIRGRIIIDSVQPTFSNLAAKMFGMPIEGEMLESFTGEFGNMLAGNICTHVGSQNVTIDITPPTVMVGQTKLYGFESAYKMLVTIDEVGELTILFTIDENE